MAQIVRMSKSTSTSRPPAFRRRAISATALAGSWRWQSTSRQKTRSNALVGNGSWYALPTWYSIEPAPAGDAVDLATSTCSAATSIASTLPPGPMRSAIQRVTVLPQPTSATRTHSPIRAAS